MSDNLDKYHLLVNSGASAQRVYLTARADGMNLIETIKLIRRLFDLSLVEAKEISVTADGRYTSLSEYQALLIPSIEQALRQLEQEEKGKLNSD